MVKQTLGLPIKDPHMPLKQWRQVKNNYCVDKPSMATRQCPCFTKHFEELKKMLTIKDVTTKVLNPVALL